MKETIEITLDNGIKKEIKTKNLTECPDCKEQSVRAKEMCEGGGVTCIKCSYWFCY